MRDVGPSPWVMPDLATASLADIFKLYGSVLDQLTLRQVVRTRNAPLGDYAEWLVAAALSGRLAADKAAKAYDLVSNLSSEVLGCSGPHEGGHHNARIQVKARLLPPAYRRHHLQTSPFHTTGFDYLALLLHNAADFSVRQATLIPAPAALKFARPASARRQDVVRLWMTSTVMTHPQAVDITEKLVSASKVATCHLPETEVPDTPESSREKG